MLKPAHFGELSQTLYYGCPISCLIQVNCLTSTSVETDLYPYMPILRPHAARYCTNGAYLAVLFIVQCACRPIRRPLWCHSA